MAFRRNIQIDAYCPAHRRATGTPADTLASCDSCFALRRLWLAFDLLQKNLREADRHGLIFRKKEVSHVHN